ncbi:AraC family transcriptional regulator (plasmid) [Paraburkholderia aromaticivorans]|uniref:AraC family transcriptional regulator n=2 Tax=Paraburkholderia aromaticivorans TaxID=2026199 RepID=A0A248VW93_9BURK|nr:AraC family transcriptional regulator [Paraburkholderia aromaticivorans]
MTASRAEVSRTYAMPERSDRLDFYIRDQGSRSAIEEPHKHEYFQIQINLGGDTEQHIGGVRRPFPAGAIAFILPHRLHLIPHPAHSRFIVINFTQAFLRADTSGIADPLDLEDVPLTQAPELAPFRLQEHIDFILEDADLAEIEPLLARMLKVNETRRFGATTLLRGYLLQLIGIVCERHAEQIVRLSSRNVQKLGRRDALARVNRHVNAHLASDALSLTSAAAATFLSPNYLTHLIKKETGRTFVEWVTERRIARARDLLANDTRRIKDIAFLVGYRDEAYFSRRFRQSVGQSPSDFRDMHRNAGQRNDGTTARKEAP